MHVFLLTLIEAAQHGEGLAAASGTTADHQYCSRLMLHLACNWGTLFHADVVCCAAVHLQKILDSNALGCACAVYVTVFSLTMPR